ncbi:ABC-F family ATP-binding cassette domain-containing protein [Convivina intestini]|uniref:ATPase subunit of ABC transporter with duplicated ATPase domains n=1 Tax=Convivina intestini TaxID=1505726 RepID=A0A2U1DEQ4_9LACO|nr:ATP-binding cassette domain-containing protein [Convivina intestini]PVY86161.1 ATPase subunit of ABC transporter with duplicated ATPase domains [Convivina intestini]CAH1851410.1 putative ABC transporter ATP-binding protein YbiT [Convivina intestini]CAH1852917.1 putative ABC transporter ATP-binding protein YbiT [Convivina intestini]SDB81160.1 ATPase components of ABC transporters with duplicated ATPase domains [Leuconostocaceae bacterium R-53105]
MITVADMSFSFSGHKLYQDVNLKLTPGHTYGIIGANGAGKSTFLKLLQGQLEPTSGTINIGEGERMSSLQQDHFAFDEFTVMDTVLQGHKRLYEVKSSMDAIYAKPDFSDEDGVQVAHLSAEFEELDGWNAEAEAAQMLTKLGINDQQQQSLMSELTENDKIKVLLAQALFGNPDILILDEPTNGLDVQTITWLEDFLADFPNLVIVVSHDRHFLNVVSTNILDVDFGKITPFVGNYDFWRESSELAQRLAGQQNAKKEEQIKQLQEFVARFSANASKSKQATARKKQLDKITLDDIKPSSRKYPYINFEINRELGNDLIRLEGVSKTIDGQKILDNINFIGRPGDKIAILSRSDLASTTLMKIIAGEMAPDEGTVTWGVTTSRSYIAKDLNDNFDKQDAVVLDWLRDFAEEEQKDNTSLRGMLGQMLFKGDDALKEISVLSGGEKVRIVLAKMMLLKANVLLMDDPTNHLDLESIQSLNDAVKSFKGSIIMTSHDHEFLETTVNHVVEVSAKGCVDRLDTTYDEFINSESIQEKVAQLY